MKRILVLLILLTATASAQSPLIFGTSKSKVFSWLDTTKAHVDGKFPVATQQFVYDNIGTGTMGGTGTTGYLAYFTGAAAVGDSPFTIDDASGWVPRDSLIHWYDSVRVNRLAIAIALDSALAANLQAITNMNDILSLLPKSDTAANVRQTHPALPNLVAPGADSNRVVKIDANGNLFKGWDNVGAGGSGEDSAATVFIDSAGVRVDQGDTLRFRRTRMFVPEWMPDHLQSAIYDAQKRTGWVEFEVVIGGNILRSVTSPAEWTFLADSGATVKISYVEITHRDVEATTQCVYGRCVDILGYTDATGGAAGFSQQGCIPTSPSAKVTFIPTTIGSRAQLKILATSLATNVEWCHCTIRVGFVMDNLQASTWYVKPINH